jgi:phosphopantetheinyl transferase
MEIFLEEAARTHGFSFGVEFTSDVAHRLAEADSGYPASVLTRTELDEFRRFAVEKRRVEWLAGRLATRSAYVRFSGGAGAEGSGERLSVLNDAHRAPFLSGRPDLRLSISHSHEYAVAVIAPFPIGIDIEKIEPRPSALIDYFFSGDEMELIRRNSLRAEETDTLITMLWSRKEAVSKVVRRGASLNFRSLTAVSDRITVEGDDPRAIHLLSARCDDYCVALAVQEQLPQEPPAHR